MTPKARLERALDVNRQLTDLRTRLDRMLDESKQEVRDARDELLRAETQPVADDLPAQRPDYAGEAAPR